MTSGVVPYPKELIEQFTETGVTVHLNLAKVQSVPGKKQFVEKVGDYTVLTTSINYASTRDLMLKRLMDIAGGLVGCLITGILFIFVAPAIYIASPGPIFFAQERVGKNGKRFKMYKFRSMTIAKDADEKSFKADTNRIFKWGAIMRATKIDELPQLLNCVLGDMAIVGPRPAAQDQVVIMREGKYGIAARVRPGLTGPAALYDYLYGDTVEDPAEYMEKVLPTRRELEAFYVHHVNVGFDLKMIVWTFLCILGRVAGKPQNWILEKLKGYVE